MFSKVSKMSRRSHRFPWPFLSHRRFAWIWVYQRSMHWHDHNHIRSLWVASISSLEEHTHCHSARIERGCIIISWTSIYLIEVTRQLGNFDVPLFNMHLNISVKPRKPCHALEKSHHLKSGGRAEWRRPTPTTMARKRGVSWMFHVQEGDFHEIIFLQSLCGLNGKEQCWQWLCTSTSASHRNPDANVRFDGIVTPPITTMHPGK